MSKMPVEVDLSPLPFAVEDMYLIFSGFIKKSFKAAEESIEEGFMDPLEHDMSFEDHSLKMLAKKDHPYAARHGEIDSASLGHDPDFIHKQTRGLFGSVKMEPGNSLQKVMDAVKQEAQRVGGAVKSYKGGQFKVITPAAVNMAFVFWVYSTSHIARFVIEGTEKMLPRPLGEDVYERNKEKIVELFKSRMGL